MRRIEAGLLPHKSWGLGFVWDGRTKDLYFYLFNLLITVDCYFWRNK